MSDDLSLVPYALAVDDDVFILMDTVDILQNAGFRTYDARDGEEATRILDEHGASITLLFTDLQMPGMNGFELARRTSARWPEIAIVVASGFRRPDEGELPTGAVFIFKPFSADVVRTHLQEILPDGKKPEPLKRAGGAERVAEDRRV